MKKAIVLRKWNGSAEDDPRFHIKRIFLVDRGFDFQRELSVWKKNNYQPGVYWPNEFLKYLLITGKAEEVPFEDYKTYF